MSRGHRTVNERVSIQDVHRHLSSCLNYTEAFLVDLSACTSPVESGRRSVNGGIEATHLSDRAVHLFEEADELRAAIYLLKLHSANGGADIDAWIVRAGIAAKKIITAIARPASPCDQWASSPAEEHGQRFNKFDELTARSAKELNDAASLLRLAASDARNVTPIASPPADAAGEYSTKHPSSGRNDPDVGNVDPLSRDTVSRFRRDGDHWLMEFRGIAKFVPHRAGFEYVAELLRKKGQDVSVSDLAARRKGSVLVRPEQESLVSPEGILKIKAEIDRLEAEERAARDRGDSASAIAAQDQLRAIRLTVKRDLNACSQSRPMRNAHEVARVSIGQGITRAIEVIEERLPQLGRHLREPIRTPCGRSSRYAPVEDIEWDLDPA